MLQKSSSGKRDNLDKYDKFINELSVWIKGGWPPADQIQYDEDLLRHTLGLHPRVKQDINRLALQPDSDKRTEHDQYSISTVTIKGELQPLIQKGGQQFSEDEELPFQ
jgi:hypothetical protein